MIPLGATPEALVDFIPILAHNGPCGLLRRRFHEEVEGPEHLHLRFSELLKMEGW